MLKSFLSTMAVGGRKASEEAVNPFFSFTSGRWLSNNDAHLKARYAPFNVDGLQRVASRTIGSQVKSMEKIAESTNRHFLVTFQNNQQVVAQIPTSLSGPPHFSTASEVATMDFLRRLGMPIPKVLAWSSRADSTDNEVESEFIIMEKAHGEPLSKMWENVDHTDLVQKLADLHRPLLNLRFTHYGSLYYKDDLDISQKSTVDFLKTIPPGIDVSPFCLGPVTREEFWEDERSSKMEVERGPWTSAVEYMLHIASREQIWIDHYAHPHLHDDFLCGLPLQGKLDDHIELLEYYKYLIPYLVPEEKRYLHGHLWHPDLHAANLFVIPSGSTTQDGKTRVNITSCVDWQGAWVGPAFLQLTVPKLFDKLDGESKALTLPPNFDTLDADTPKEAERSHKEFSKLFEALALQDIAQLPALDERRLLEALSQGTWKTGLLPFRWFLIEVLERWDEISPGHECPINFAPKYIEDHESAFAYWFQHFARANALDEEFSIGAYGYVAGDEAHFERVKKQLEKRRKEWEASGETSEEQCMIRAFLWPYRDTLSDHPRTHLKHDPGTKTSDDVPWDYIFII